jgi:hypothetical protein
MIIYKKISRWGDQIHGHGDFKKLSLILEDQIHEDVDLQKFSLVGGDQICVKDNKLIPKLQEAYLTRNFTNLWMKPPLLQVLSN